MFLTLDLRCEDVTKLKNHGCGNGTARTGVDVILLQNKKDERVGGKM
jgi:hypothetical protein